ncbi:MAG: YicC family protein [Spirochaetaceae bacterium]|jgi:uncharacterized protein (TIGR00255 family)|nr:YicC family protein [Spirochaetaceae bacterium]
MTGYASVEKNVNGYVVSVEIRGYNSRFLETIVSLPPPMNAAESFVRNTVAEKCRRGKIEVSIRLKSERGPRPPVINKNAALAYAALFKALAELAGSDEKLAVRDLIKADGILETNRDIYGANDAERLIMPPLVAALDLFDAERKREGENTRQNILFCLSNLEESEKKIRELAPKEEAQLKTVLQRKFAEMTGMAIDENRLLGEVALLVMKYTISEELARLESHFSEFAADAKSNASLGKKLDFFCQEINREVNTIGSKSQSVEIIREVVSMKENIENIREQLRNIE